MLKEPLSTIVAGLGGVAGGGAGMNAWFRYRKDRGDQTQALMLSVLDTLRGEMASAKQTIAHLQETQIDQGEKLARCEMEREVERGRSELAQERLMFTIEQLRAEITKLATPGPTAG